MALKRINKELADLGRYVGYGRSPRPHIPSLMSGGNNG